MNRYWLGIGAGALLIFGVGMTGISLGKKGLHELKTAVGAPVAEALQGPIGALRFQLDGERIGRVQSVDVQSKGGWASDAVQIVVGLEDASLAEDLEECGIAGGDFRGPKHDARFRCVSEARVARDRLVQIGEVRFEPGSLVRPLYINPRERRQLERSAVRELKANLRSSDGESVTGTARYDFETERGRRERGVVNLQAGDGGALIDIRDEHGKRVFHLSANESGVSINASDGKGHDLVRLLAGAAGVSIKVDNERH